MKVICKPRNSGKTTQLIKESHDKWLYIVCINREAADWTFDYAIHKLGIDIPNPITFDDLVKGKFCARGIKGFLIDDFDLMIEQLLNRISRGVPIETIVINERKSKKWMS